MRIGLLLESDKQLAQSGEPGMTAFEPPALTASPIVALNALARDM